MISGSDGGVLPPVDQVPLTSSIEPLLAQLLAVKAAIIGAERAECAKVIQQFVERVEIKFLGEPAPGRTRDVEVTFLPKQDADDVLPGPMKLRSDRTGGSALRPSALSLEAPRAECGME